MVQDNNILFERDLLKKITVEDFGTYSAKIFSFCTDPVSGRPLYLTHLPLAIQASGFKGDLDQETLENLSAGYVYLIACYYCIDSFVDFHGWGVKDEEDVTRAIDISLLLSTSQLRFFRAVSAINPSSLGWFIENFRNVVFLNAQALHEELSFRSKVDTVFDESSEFFSMWARSNPFLFIFQLLFQMSDKCLSSRDEGIIKKILYWLQWGDDIGDWREDYAKRKWTPFLRICMNDVGFDSTEEEVEDHIYFNGIIEKYLSKVLFELEKLSNELTKQEEFGQLVKFVKMQVAKAEHLLEQIIIAKLSNDNNHE
jgi:hypothetical protein